MMADGVYSIHANGIAHWVRVAGAENAGTPLVLLHGGPGACAYPWEAIGDRLARHVPVVFYDQRACGRSEAADPATYTMAQLVADLDVLRAALRLQEFAPWGVSFGAILAAEYAVAHPTRVTHLIMQAPSIVSPLHPGPWALRPASVETVIDPAARHALRAALAGVHDPMQRLWIALESLDPESRQRYLYHDPAKAAAAAEAAATAPDYGYNEDFARAIFGAVRNNLIDDLATSRIPALVMVGLWDRNAGVDTSRDLAARMPSGRLHLFARSAHLPHEEEPEEYCAVIEDFLRS